MKTKSVIFSGVQGTGKTTLTNAWSAEFGVPIKRIDTRSRMPVGINSHLDVLRMAVQSPAEGVKFQAVLVSDRANMIETHRQEAYVSDRGVVDSLVYYAMHNSMFSDDELTSSMVEESSKSLLNTDLTVLVSRAHTSAPIEDNNVRITNDLYATAAKGAFLSVYIEVLNKLGVSLSSMTLHEAIGASIRSIVLPNGKVFMVLDEYNGMIPTEHRIRFINYVYNKVTK